MPEPRRSTTVADTPLIGFGVNDVTPRTVTSIFPADDDDNHLDTHT